MLPVKGARSDAGWRGSSRSSRPAAESQQRPNSKGPLDRIPSSGSMRSRSTASLSYGLSWPDVDALGIMAAMIGSIRGNSMSAKHVGRCLDRGRCCT